MKQIPIFTEDITCFLDANCSKEWLPAILANKKCYKVKKGEVIFKEGGQVRGMYFVNKGIVKFHKHWNSEKELIIRFAGAGAILGHRGLGKDATYPASATAIQEGIISYIDMDFFRSTLRTNNTFALKLLLFFDNELRESERKVRNLAHMPVKGRVAEALILLKDQFGLAADGSINIKLTRRELASFAGATYETLFRVINELVGDKLLTLSGKGISIINTPALAALAGIIA